MKIYGTFLLLGPGIDPQVVALSDTGLRDFNSRLEIATKHEKDSSRHEAYRLTFGVRAHYAIPCWSVEAMTKLATEYKGENEKQVRGLAARIALGQPYGGPEPGARSGETDGGQRAPIDPVKPKPRKPSGGNAAPLTAEQLLFGDGKRAKGERAAERQARRMEALQA